MQKDAIEARFFDLVVNTFNYITNTSCEVSVIEKTEENKCICKEFREQMADPDFEGYCHCMLYYKSK